MQIEGSFSALVADVFTNSAGYSSQGMAKVQFTVAGETRQPFTRAGAAAAFSRQVNRIRIEATDDAGDFRWQIRFSMDPYRVPLAPVVFDLGYWTVQAQLFQGAPWSAEAQTRTYSQIKGTLELTQVSTNLGGTISGKFKINTTAFEEKRP